MSFNNDVVNWKINNAYIFRGISIRLSKLKTFLGCRGVARGASVCLTEALPCDEEGALDYFRVER